MDFGIFTPKTNSQTSYLQGVKKMWEIVGIEKSIPA